MLLSWIPGYAIFVGSDCGWKDIADTKQPRIKLKSILLDI